MLGFDAVVPLDISKLDMTLVRKLQAIPNMVKHLDDWVLAPDKDLLPRLNEYAAILKRICPLPRNVRLFRGFDPSSSYQDTLGLSEKGFFRNKVRSFAVGEKISYTILNPLSFSTSEDIAKAFGDTVVVLSKIPDNYIWLCDELSYLISVERKVSPQSQKEVIVLPPATLELTVVRK